MSACTHHNLDGSEALQLIQGFSDRRPRGVCRICHKWITPLEWINMHEMEGPNGPIVVATEKRQHPDYYRVEGLMSSWQAAHEDQKS